MRSIDRYNRIFTLCRRIGLIYVGADGLFHGRFGFYLTPEKWGFR